MLYSDGAAERALHQPSQPQPLWTTKELAAAWQWRRVSLAFFTAAAFTCALLMSACNMPSSQVAGWVARDAAGTLAWRFMGMADVLFPFFRAGCPSSPFFLGATYRGGVGEAGAADSGMGRPGTSRSSPSSTPSGDANASISLCRADSCSHIHGQFRGRACGDAGLGALHAGEPLAVAAGLTARVGLQQARHEEKRQDPHSSLIIAAVEKRRIQKEVQLRNAMPAAPGVPARLSHAGPGSQREACVCAGVLVRGRCVSCAILVTNNAGAAMRMHMPWARDRPMGSSAGAVCPPRG
jgi:hypothetical protein